METNAQYFDCLCRTCMNKVEASSHDGTTKLQQQWISISDIIEECGALRIAALLSDAVPQIVVHPTDDLPKKICTECLQRLLSVYRFQQMCVRSDKQMHELLSKEQIVMKTPILEEEIKGEIEINDADSQPLEDLAWSSTLQNLQQPSIQEPLAEVTVPTIEPDAAQSRADEHLQDNTQLLEQCMDAQGEFEEFIKNEPNEGDKAKTDKATTHLKTPVLEEAIKGATETNDADSQPLKELRCSSTLQNLQQPSIQEPLAEVTVQTSEPEAAQSSAANHLQDNSQLLEYCNDSQGEFEEFIKNEPIEDDEEANSEYSGGDTIHSTISIIKDELLEPDDQQLNDCLTEHRETHSEDKPYECPYRRLRFTSKSHMACHETSHERIKPHKCDICGKEFKIRSSLIQHKQIHNEEKPHKCDVCEKRFTWHYQLVYHIRIHPGEKPFLGKQSTEEQQQQQQKLSNKDIEQPSTDIVAEQRTTHAKHLPYECPYCPLIFSSKRNASRHKTIHEGIKPHKCSICGKKFRLKSCLVTHKRTHSKERPYKCDQCEKQFAQIKSLKAHIYTHTGEKPYKCKYCECRFISTGRLSSHLHRHLGKNIFKCKFCPLAFPSSEEMHLHLTSHKNEDQETRDRNLKALQEEEVKLKLKFSKEKSKGQSTEEQQQQKLCNKKSEQQSTDILAEQRTTHNEDKPFECPYCPLRFNSKSGVSIHKAIHEEAKRQECDICGKDFKTRASLITHKRIHSEEKPHKCDFCEKRFTHMQPLQIHIRTHTGEKPYKCKYCERRFISSSLLSSHLRRHLGKNIYRCKFCPLAFPLAAEMRLHLTSHKNEDPEVRDRNLKALKEEEAKLVLKFSKEKSKGESREEQQQQKLSNKKIKQPSTDIPAEQRTTHTEECPYCPLRFSSKPSVWLHKKSHEGIKPHNCSICGKKFRVKHDLAIHTRIHSKEKPYKCDICEKRFARTQHLKVHIRTHTGERPYKCKYCELRFISTSSISVHLRSHLGKNIYRCKFCPIAFPLESEMRLHLISHKNEDPETRERNLKALQEEEVKLELKFSKEKSKGQSTEEQQQQKLCNKEIEQQSTDIMADQHTTHSEDKPCGRKIRRKSDLMRDKRIHSKEKPHKCDLCEKRFTHLQRLKNHIRTHTGEKPYKCKYCERRFISNGLLTQHIHSHLGKNIHRCKFCPLAFPSYAEMRLHFTSHKSEDPETRERNLKALQEEEAKFVLKFSKKKVKDSQQKTGRSCVIRTSHSTQQSEASLKNLLKKSEPIEDDKFNSEYSDEECMHSTISVTKDESEEQQVNET